MKTIVAARMNLAAMLGMFGVRGLPSLPKHPKPVYGRTVHSGGTFNVGRNAEKREARSREIELRRDQVAALHSGLIVYAPKRHQSRKTVDMLSNRRLRQSGATRG